MWHAMSRWYAASGAKGVGWRERRHRPTRLDRSDPAGSILVVGPSGAGKDTLLGLARAACAEDRSVVFPRRVVTREASAFEDNEQVSFETFRQARASGAFAVHWEAHGHGYGLTRAIDDDLRAGRTVVANVSRTVIDAVRRAYANVTVVSITAPPEILAARLAARARDSDGQIEGRLKPCRRRSCGSAGSHHYQYRRRRRPCARTGADHQGHLSRSYRPANKQTSLKVLHFPQIPELGRGRPRRRCHLAVKCIGQRLTLIYFSGGGHDRFCTQSEDGPGRARFSRPRGPISTRVSTL